MFVVQGCYRCKISLLSGGDKGSMARYIRDKLMCMWAKGMRRKRNEWLSKKLAVHFGKK